MELTKKQQVAAVISAVVVGTAALTGGLNYLHNQKQDLLDPNWTLVSNADDGGRWYIDNSTLTYEDNRYVQGWVLLSQAKSDKDGTRSVKFNTIFDCQGRQYRFMSGAGTDGPNGHGAGTGILEAGPTRDLPPGSNVANVADYVCSNIGQQQNDNSRI